MTLADKNSLLADIIFHDPGVISVLNRFGITLGVGNMSVGDVCREKNIPVDFFIGIINTYLNASYTPELLTSDDSVGLIINYLQKTDIYYREIQLPNVDNHFRLLMRADDKDGGNLKLLKNFFQEVKNMFGKVYESDIDKWFPFLLSLQDVKGKREKQSLFCEFYRVNKEISPFTNSLIEESLTDLLTFFTVHLKGEYNQNLSLAVVTALFMLDKDVRQNGRIREKILFPAVCNSIFDREFQPDLLEIFETLNSQ